MRTIKMSEGDLFHALQILRLYMMTVSDPVYIALYREADYRISNRLNEYTERKRCQPFAKETLIGISFRDAEKALLLCALQTNTHPYNNVILPLLQVK